MPVWLLLIVMSLAVYRLTRLVVTDTFPPVLWARDRIAGGWRELTPGETFDESDPGYAFIDDSPHRYVRRAGWSPQWLADLVSCGWCAGGWITLGVTAATDAFIGVPVPVLVGFAVWGAGSLLTAQDWA